MAKIHYDELTVGVPSKASSVNYENSDGTKESVQSKIEHMETVELTKEAYDALSYAEKHNGKDYLVKGMSPMTAYNMPYNDSTVGDGLDDIKQNLGNLSSASAVSGNDAFSKINSLNSKFTDNVLTNIDLIYWAEQQPQGLIMFRTNATVTGLPNDVQYALGFYMNYSGNIKLLVFDMFSNVARANSKSISSGTWVGWSALR